MLWQEPARQAVWMSGEATSTSSSAAPAPEVDMTAAAAAAAAAARTAAAEAAPPAWAAHSGVTTLDCLPMPAWIVAAAKPKRPAVGLAVSALRLACCGHVSCTLGCAA